MIEGLIWFGVSVGALLLIIRTVPKSIMASVDSYRKRHVEMSTPGLPSAVCPVDGGSWGPWSSVNETKRPNNPKYPTLDGTHIIRSQFRQCTDCGFAERRVL